MRCAAAYGSRLFGRDDADARLRRGDESHANIYAGALSLTAISAAAGRVSRRTTLKSMTKPLARRSGTAKIRKMYCSGQLLSSR